MGPLHSALQFFLYTMASLVACLGLAKPLHTDRQRTLASPWERRAHQAAVIGPWIDTTPERAG